MRPLKRSSRLTRRRWQEKPVEAEDLGLSGLDSVDPNAPAADLYSGGIKGVLSRRRRSFAAAVVIGGIIIAAVVMLLPPVYSAKSQLIIDSSPRTSDQSIAQAALLDDREIETHVAMLMSRGQIERVINKMASSRFEQTSSGESESPPSLVQAFLKREASPLALLRSTFQHARTFLLPAEPAEPGGVADEGDRTRVYESFLRSFSVQQERRSRVINVIFRSHDQALAVRIANLIADEYITALTEQNSRAAQLKLQRAQKRASALQASTEKADAALQEFRVQHGLLDGGKRGGDDVDLSAVAARLDVIDAEIRQRISANRRATIREDNGRNETVSDLPPTGPGSADGSDRGFGLLIQQSQSLREQMEILRRSNSSAADLIVRLRSLERDSLARGAQLDSFLRSDADSEELMQPPGASVHLLSLAAASSIAEGHSRLLFIPPSLFLLAIFGVGVAIAADRMDLTVRREEDVRTKLGVPLAGVVPYLRQKYLKKAGSLTRDDAEATFPKSISALALSLGLLDGRSAPQVIAVLSSLPGEGKTVLATSIATRASTAGKRVVVVDMSFDHDQTISESDRRSSGFSGGRGEAPPFRDDLGFDFLPGPRVGRDQLASLTSSNWRTYLSSLRRSYDCVIIDGPAVLPAAEAVLIASFADLVVFSIKWGSTEFDLARCALRMLGLSGINPPPTRIAAALTQVNLKQHSAGNYGSLGKSLFLYSRESPSVTRSAHARGI